MKKTQVQGVHHITIVGSTKQSAVDFWEGVLGMPFLFEQPNLGKPDENHLYFDPGDGRLLTVFTNESREDARRKAPREIGCVEHLAFNDLACNFPASPLILSFFLSPFFIYSIYFPSVNQPPYKSTRFILVTPPKLFGGGGVLTILFSSSREEAIISPRNTSPPLLFFPADRQRSAGIPPREPSKPYWIPPLSRVLGLSFYGFFFSVNYYMRFSGVPWGVKLRQEWR